jgi:hypothetical protein
MAELNPNHPVTQEVHDRWPKVCAILMMRLGKTSLEITEADAAALGNNEKR